MGTYEDEQRFLSGLASAAFGVRVGEVGMPLYGVGAGGHVVYGSREQGFLHLNVEAIRDFRGEGGGGVR